MPIVHEDRFAPTAYRLSRDQLADLATGNGSTATLHFLTETQLSRRTLLLCLLRDRAATSGLGPLPPVDEAWDVMDRAKKMDRPTFGSVIMHPQIGNWAAYALRTHSSEADDAGPAPRWVDFGHLHAVALVAAARCEQHWQTRVPLRQGRVTLPGLGQARFETVERWDWATAETVDGRIRLHHGGTTVVVPPELEQDAPGWWAMRMIATGNDPVLRVTLNDLDPFRNLADPVDPERLTDTEVAHWRTLLGQAWDLLCHDDPATARAMTVAVTSLAPLARADQADEEEIRSASTAEAFGAVVLSTPHNAVDFAATLVHEYQHIKLGCLMHLCTLSREDGRANLYAPWRDDPRPLGGLIQGIYAFHGIAGFFRTRARYAEGAERRAALYSYALARAQTAEGLAVARAAGGLTDIGRELLDGLDATMRPWLADEIPDDIARLVRLAVTAHRITWYLRHRRPAPAAVAAFARAWARSEPLDEAATGAGTIVPPDEPPQLSTTWTRPIRQAVNTSAPTSTPEATLIVGDAEAAKAAFVARVESNPDDLAAWTGLALTCAELGEADAAHALGRRPDLVRAGYLAIRAAGDALAPDRLAAWAGRRRPSA